MITNILATITITLLTNTVDVPIEFDHFEPIPCPDGMFGCLVYHQKGVNPTARNITTNIIEQRTISFTFEGQPIEAKTQRTLWSTNFVLRHIWNKEP